MVAGDIIFVRGTSFVSKLVRFFDKGRFSHVAIAVSDREVIEVNWYMRSKIVPVYYEDYEIKRLPLSLNQKRRVPVVAKGYTGRYYDYLQIVSFIFRGSLNNPRHLICSELVYNILNDVGYICDDNLRDSTPNELYAYLNRVG